MFMLMLSNINSTEIKIANTTIKVLMSNSAPVAPPSLDVVQIIVNDLDNLSITRNGSTIDVYTDTWKTSGGFTTNQPWVGYNSGDTNVVVSSVFLNVFAQPAFKVHISNASSLPLQDRVGQWGQSLPFLQSPAFDDFYIDVVDITWLNLYLNNNTNIFFHFGDVNTRGTYAYTNPTFDPRQNMIYP